MKVECVKQNLKEALLTAERFTGKQLSLPVLKYVLLIAGEKNIKLRATNLDCGIEIEIPARIEKEGVMAVPADTLGNFLSHLPQEKNITLELVGEHLTISGSSYSTLIKGFGYEDFPTLPFVYKGESIDINSKQLLGAFRSTIFSVAQTDIKPEFGSVNMYTDGNALVFASTDSSRLSEKRVLFKKEIGNLNVLIPSKNVNEIIRALEPINEEMNIIATKNQISFHSEHIHITSRLIDGMFPDYKQIIPKQFFTEAVLLRQDLLDRLKIASVFSGKLQQIRMKMYPEDKLFEIDSRNDEVGETTQQIDATLKGENVEMLFNQRFLLDVLQFLTADSISLQSGGHGKPLIIKGVGDPSFTYLVMPMKG